MAIFINEQKPAFNIEKWKCGYCNHCGSITGLKEGFCVNCGCRFEKAFKKKKPNSLRKVHKNCPLHGDIITEKQSIECPICFHVITGLKVESGKIIEIKTGYVFNWQTNALDVPELF